MPAFSFEALDAQGQTRKGLLEADTAKSARSMLRAQALVPLTVELVQTGQTAAGGGTSLGQRLFTRPVFSATTLAVWTRQLAGLVSSGLPLERALTALSDEADDERQSHLVAALRAEVNAGSTFARALSQHPREFSDIYCAVIGAGEHSGNLGMVLEKLADDLEDRQALKAKLVGAALYPAIVTVVAIVIVLFLVGYVVPQVASVFAGTKRALPFLTVMMLTISSIVRNYGWWMLVALILIAASACWALTLESFRQKFDAAWLNLPLVGKLARGYNAARFAGTLAMLAGAASPVALFTIGAVLARSQMNQQEYVPPGQYVPIALAKLVVHPLLVWCVGRAAMALGVDLSPFTLTVMVLLAALPSASNVALLVERFGSHGGRVARIILVSTALAFLSFSAAVALLVQK